MKKIKASFIILIIVFNLVSCSGRSEIIFTGYTESVSETIIECFNNEDIEGLMKIMSPYVLETREVEEQIEDAFNEIEGKIISYEVLSFGYDGSIRDGVWVVKNEQVTICDIKTDAGEEYITDYSEYINNDYDESKEGVYIIILRDKDTKLIQKIGGIKKENT